jgi:hypothetical protein
MVTLKQTWAQESILWINSGRNLRTKRYWGKIKFGGSSF